MKASQIVNEALTSPIYQHLQETPLQLANKLSTRLGCNLYLKREDHQPIFSFKVRGAYHKMLKLDAKHRKKGVIAASAGNHAQGVAHASKALGIPCHIYMPEKALSIKVNAVKDLGAKVTLVGNDFLATLDAAKKHAKKHNLILFHPFDDDDVISGQATIGAELLRTMPDTVETIFLACGGGGLLAGVATVIKQLRPKIKVYGVEPIDAASMELAFKKGKPAKLDYVGTFAETVAVAQVGQRNYKLAKEYVDGIIVVDIRSICNAIKDIYEDTRTIVEPAGALGVAGAKKFVKMHKNKQQSDIATVLCGANMNFDSLGYVIERSSAGQESEMLLAAEIPEKPGSFLMFCRILGKRHVREFNYRYSQAKQAHIFAGITITGYSERKPIIKNLKDHGINAYDLTGDETAELHVRHMVGGRAAVGPNEQVYRFEFPERTGALLNFLTALNKDWNISLFHYRYHGADVGRVLIGFQVPKSKSSELEKSFKEIGYPFWLVENNNAYEMFLADPSL